MNTTQSNMKEAGSASTGESNAAKGNLQGQTTLAAKIFRWEALVNNMPEEIATLPQVTDTLAQFEAVLMEAKNLVDLYRVTRGEARDTLIRRNEVLVQGDDLYNRLGLGVKSVLGPRSGRLVGVGIKPRKVGRPRAGTEVPVPAPPPPAPEAPTAPLAAAAAQPGVTLKAELHS